MIDETKIRNLLEKTKKTAASQDRIDEILSNAKEKATKPSSEFEQNLTLEDVATLLNID